MFERSDANAGANLLTPPSKNSSPQRSLSVNLFYPGRRIEGLPQEIRTELPECCLKGVSFLHCVNSVFGKNKCRKTFPSVL